MNKKKFKKEIKTIFNPLKYIKKETILLTLRSLYSGFTAFFITIAFERITKHITNNSVDGIIFWGSLAFVIVVLYFIMQYILRYATPNMFWGVLNVLEKIYLRKFFFINNIDKDRYGSGRLITILKTGFRDWAEFLTNFMSDTIRTLFLIVLSFGFVYYLDSTLFYYMLPLFFLLSFIMFITNKKANEYRAERKENDKEYTRNFVKMIEVKYDVLQSDNIDKELEKSGKLVDNFKKLSRNIFFYLFLMYQVPNLFQYGFRLFVIIFVGINVIEGNYTMAQFVGLTAVSEVIDGLLFNLARQIEGLYKVVPSIWKIIELYEDVDYIENYGKGNKYKFINGDISIENLTFTYSKEQENKVNVFNDFSLSIKGNQKVAILGKSGCGKSTLLKLLSGYYNYENGSIKIDNQELNNLDLKTYYNKIGFLDQEPNIFDGTIKENLLYGINRKVGEKEIEEVIKKSDCEFVYDLENGIETEVGERGVMLSGGQKQRLNIAKIFLKDPKILFLDEPTSALDSFSEEKITNAINNLMVGRTVIVTAHRLQTVKNANVIYIIGKNENKQNTLLEKGNHNELMKNGKIYKQMVDLQSGIINE